MSIATGCNGHCRENERDWIEMVLVCQKKKNNYDIAKKWY